MNDFALLIDYKYCTGCHVCEVSCRKEHDIPLDEWGIKLAEMGPKTMGPEKKWLWDYVPVPSNLCDLCADRRAEGKDPRCVHHCLAQCIQVIPIEETAAKLAEHGKKCTVFVP